jgi:formate--tetrahydrofolate ligase
MKSDIEIASNIKLKKIQSIAKDLGILEDQIEPYGSYKAKITLDVLDKASDKKGHVVLVTAINPTPAGEGKTTTTVALGQAFSRIGEDAIIALREPSFGPVLGMKGGAAGGGYSQVLPMEDINLHFTGDIHAVTTANNLVSAMIDNHIHQGNELNIDPRRITWKRALDMNDRALRQTVIGLGGHTNGHPREDGFMISVASEIMAGLCLSKDLVDLKNRVRKMLVGYTYDRMPVTIGDLQCEGAVTTVLKDAIKPNLVQTTEHTPALIHGGPFANIAHGCNSIIATNMGRKLADYVITEAGFGADLGAEKFLNIKTKAADFTPSAVVVVATIKALKMHGGVSKDDLGVSNVGALLEGVSNLEKHIDTITAFGLPYVVAINHFVHDAKEEVDALESYLKDHSHPFAVSKGWAEGGEGAVDLARKVIEEIKKTPNKFKRLYESTDSIEQKIKAVAQTVYGAEDVVFTKEAKNQLRQLKKLSLNHLDVCMAKTQYSLSDQPKKLGRPTGFKITVRELRPSIGAGFVVALTGEVMTMPGLPKKPAALQIDIDNDGKISGLF